MIEHDSPPTPSRRPGRWVALLTALLLAAAPACSENNDENGSDSDTANETAGETDNDDGATGAGGDPDVGPGEAEVLPWDQIELSLVPVVTDLSQPIALAVRPGSDDLWVLEREGRVRLIERTAEQFALVDTPVADISDQVGTAGEGGLIGLAFSADGDSLYLHYTDRDGDTVVSELTMGDTTADVASERVLLGVDQPYPNHNGGDLKLGPDGYLYIALGDGGSADDPHGNGQDTTTLLGTILRIDPTPSDDAPYTIPPDNPFVDADDRDGSGREEIWLWGARNPWRFSFDADTDDLWIGDVGQNMIEEVDYLPAAEGGGQGANLGWSLMEGNDIFAGNPPADHVGPIHTYTHDGGRCSITGGHVYRGSLVPSLDGIYLFADYCSGEVFGLERQPDGSAIAELLRLNPRPSEVISFGEGPDGELYVLEQNGTVSRIELTSANLDSVA